MRDVSEFIEADTFGAIHNSVKGTVTFFGKDHEVKFIKECFGNLGDQMARLRLKLYAHRDDCKVYLRFPIDDKDKEYVMNFLAGSCQN